MSAPRATSPFWRTRKIKGRSSNSAEQLALGSRIEIPTDLWRSNHARVPNATSKTSTIALSIHLGRSREAAFPIAHTDYAENPPIRYCKIAIALKTLNELKRLVTPITAV